MKISDRILLSRRAVLRTLPMGAAAAAIGTPLRGNAQSTTSRDAAALAASGSFLLRGGHVLTMDESIGDVPIGDVLIRDGEIVEVGERINASDAELIDATDSIVMPGFVDTHFHMWSSIWRGTLYDASAYFRMQPITEHYTPEDHYTAVLYAAYEAINAGFTTCHNWAHGIRSTADAMAEIRALRDTGLRARMGYLAVLPDGPVPLEDLRAALAWIEENGSGRLSLGMILDGAGDAVADQVAVARRLGLQTITDHGGLLRYPDLFGPELFVTHGTDLTPEAMAVIAGNGLKVALCPSTDPLIGAGLPPIYPLLEAGVPLSNISFTIDVTAQTPADPFEMMRTLVNAGRIQQANSNSLMVIARSAPDWEFSYRDALELGTLSGANVLGIADQVGSLTPGKRADVITIRKDDLNMLPAEDTDPAYQLVQHAQPANIDTVIIDGRLRKFAGRLVGVDIDEVVRNAAAAQDAIQQRAG